MDMRVEEDSVVGHPQPKTIEGKRVCLSLLHWHLSCVCVHMCTCHMSVEVRGQLEGAPSRLLYRLSGLVAAPLPAAAHPSTYGF